MVLLLATCGPRPTAAWQWEVDGFQIIMAAVQARTCLATRAGNSPRRRRSAPAPDSSLLPSTAPPPAAGDAGLAHSRLCWRVGLIQGASRRSCHRRRRISFAATTTTAAASCHHLAGGDCSSGSARASRRRHSTDDSVPAPSAAEDARRVRARTRGRRGRRGRSSQLERLQRASAQAGGDTAARGVSSSRGWRLRSRGCVLGLQWRDDQQTGQHLPERQREGDASLTSSDRTRTCCSACRCRKLM